MTFTDWLKQSRELITEQGLRRGGRLAATEFGVGVGRRVGKRINYGQSFWERGDWDVLVLLDACRWDLMKSVSDNWPFIPDDVPSVYSPASMSEEFLERHLADEYQEEINRTALVAANAFTRHDWVREAGWPHLDEVWTHSWSEEDGTVLPRSVTDAAIDYWRRDDREADQMIVWYLQPHGPFVNEEWSHGFDKAEIGNGAGIHKSVWNRYRDGELSREKLWNGYRRNLEYALEDVQLLLRNLDAENVVISSDHANGLGELGVYGHPKYVPAPPVKRVPWVDTTATDEQGYDPEYQTRSEEPETSDMSVDDRLAALGYA